MEDIAELLASSSDSSGSTACPDDSSSCNGDEEGLEPAQPITSEQFDGDVCSSFFSMQLQNEQAKQKKAVRRQSGEEAGPKTPPRLTGERDSKPRPQPAQEVSKAPERTIALSGGCQADQVHAWKCLAAHGTFFGRSLRAMIAERMSKPINFFPPALRVMLRRRLRRVRLAQLVKTMRLPSIDELKKDALLKLYPASQLQQFIDSLKPQYYFPKESIIVRGLLERESYFVSSGSVNVVIGRKTVATIPSGCVLGTQGMISGEPRTASIIAKDACLIWRVTKDDFELGQDASNSGNHRQQAFSMTRDFRGKNFRELYGRFLKSDYLKKFTVFSGLSTRALDSIFLNANPRILRHHEVVDLRETRCAYYILHGRITMRPSTLCDGETIEGEVLQERLAHFAETQNYCARKPPTAGALEWFGPILLGVPNLFLDRQERFEVVSQGFCDTYEIPWEIFEHQERHHFEKIRRNCLALRCPFMKPLSPRDLIGTLFSGSLSFSFLRGCLKATSVTQQPHVFAPKDVIEFDGNGDFYIVTVGEVEGVEREAPFVWPEMHFVHFGEACTSTTVSRVEAIRLKRSELLTSLIAELQSSDMETLVQVITSLYMTKCGKKPSLNEEGLPQQDESRLGQRSKAFHELHIAVSKGSQPVHIVNALRIAGGTSPASALSPPLSPSLSPHPPSGLTRMGSALNRQSSMSPRQMSPQSRPPTGGLVRVGSTLSSNSPHLGKVGSTLSPQSPGLARAGSSLSPRNGAALSLQSDEQKPLARIPSRLR